MATNGVSMLDTGSLSIIHYQLSIVIDTEIYTHITTKGFDQIKSPLDNLDF